MPEFKYLGLTDDMKRRRFEAMFKQKKPITTIPDTARGVHRQKLEEMRAAEMDAHRTDCIKSVEDLDSGRAFGGLRFPKGEWVGVSDDNRFAIEALRQQADVFEEKGGKRPVEMPPVIVEQPEPEGEPEDEEIDLDGMTKAQLQEYAANMLDLLVDPDEMKKAEMIEAIKGAQGG